MPSGLELPYKYGTRLEVKKKIRKSVQIKNEYLFFFTHTSIKLRYRTQKRARSDHLMLLTFYYRTKLFLTGKYWPKYKIILASIILRNSNLNKFM